MRIRIRTLFFAVFFCMLYKPCCAPRLFCALFSQAEMPYSSFVLYSAKQRCHAQVLCFIQPSKDAMLKFCVFFSQTEMSFSSFVLYSAKQRCHAQVFLLYSAKQRCHAQVLSSPQQTCSRRQTRTGIGFFLNRIKYGF
jgi:hypothetical protein